MGIYEMASMLYPGIKAIICHLKCREIDKTEITDMEGQIKEGEERDNSAASIKEPKDRDTARA